MCDTSVLPLLSDVVSRASIASCGSSKKSLSISAIAHVTFHQANQDRRANRRENVQPVTLAVATSPRRVYSSAVGGNSLRRAQKSYEMNDYLNGIAAESQTSPSTCSQR